MAADTPQGHGMTTRSLAPLFDRLCRSALRGDTELLAAFADRRDEAAFAELVRRHGPMVRAVGRRAGGDADDVLQATFLALARHAAALRHRPALGPWLYTVAYRTACSARTAEDRRRRREEQAQPVAPVEPSTEAAWRELRRLLDEELNRLPELLRAPLVLCYLQGRTRDETAAQLGWSLATLKRRLERGRAVLEARLRGRGVSLAVAGWALFGSDAALPAELVREMARAAGRVAPLTAGPVGLKAALLLALGLGLAAGAALRPGPSPASDPPVSQPPPVASQPAPRTDAFGDPLPEHALARLGTVRMRTGGPVTGLMFLPGDKELISASYDGTLRVWDLATGKESRRIAGGLDLFVTAALSPDGKLIAAVTNNDSAVHVWDVATGREVHTFGNKPSHPPTLAFSPDGRTLAAGYAGEKLVRLYDVATGNELRQFQDGMEAVQSVAFTPDGRTLVAGDDSGSVFVWDVGGKLQRSWKTQQWAQRVRGLAVAPDGRTVATTLGGKVHLWEVGSGREIRRFEPGGRVERLAFAPDGLLAVGGSGPDAFGFAQLWDPATGKEGQRWYAAGFGIGALAFSNDGRMLATAGNDCRIRLWETNSDKELKPADGDASRALTAAYSPDGRFVATGGMDGAVRLWEAATGRLLHRCGPHLGWVNRVAFTPDGRRLLSVGSDGTIRVWDTTTGKELRLIGTQFECDSYTAGLAVSSDGRTVTAKCSGDTVRTWDLETGRELRRITVAGRSLQLALSPDGRTLATAEGEKSDEGSVVRLWDWPAGTERRKWTAPNRHASSLAFSPDGQFLALGCRGGEPPKLWTAATGRERPLVGVPAGGSIEAVAFSPDGRRLALAGYGGTIGLWELATGQPCRRWDSGQFAVFALDFAPDGRALVSANGDGTALVWDLTAGPAPRDLSPDDLDRIGRDLSGADAVRAWQAVQTLAAVPGRGVPWLRERLRPAAGSGDAALARLVADLAGDRFADRERATAALERLGDLAGPALRQALAGGPSLEARRRIERLLDRLDAPLTDPALLLAVRGVEVLERAGTPEARALLGELAKGAAGARRTGEAKTALGRLTVP
jgi:RNA polymerase sigma factor (sigma-70 family)